MPDPLAPEQAGRRFDGRPRVALTRRLQASVEARMAELFDIVPNVDDVPFGPDRLVAAMRDADVLVPTVTDRVDADALAAAAGRLKLIASFGAGTDHIDLAAARAHGIIVTNTPGVFTDDTADLTMALIIGVPRRLSEGVRLVREDRWSGWAPSAMLGRRLGGSRLGIVGMGRIGQAVAQRARAFGLQIVYNSRRRLPATAENMLAATYEPDLDRMVESVDILTLHCPATPETRHLLDARRIAMMKHSAVIVNTARGELIDQEALINALESSMLGGAGLDVYEGEPDVDPRLLRLPNIIHLPHLGSATVEGREASGEKIIANIRVWADGHRPPDQVLDGLV